MHQRHRSFQLLMPIFSEKWRHFVAVNVFANHVYNLIKWGKSSQNPDKQRIEDSDNDNEQNKSKTAAPKNIKLPVGWQGWTTFREGRGG